MERGILLSGGRFSAEQPADREFMAPLPQFLEMSISEITMARLNYSQRAGALQFTAAWITWQTTPATSV